MRLERKYCMFKQSDRVNFTFTSIEVYVVLSDQRNSNNHKSAELLFLIGNTMSD